MQALILDMDGTMVDSERLLVGVLVQVSGEMGTPYAAEVLMRTIGTTAQESDRIMMAAYPDFAHEAIRAESGRRFIQMEKAGEVPVMKGLFALLDAAKARGMRIAMCTSTRREQAQALIDAVGIAPYIEAAVCGGEAAQGKPAPDPYLLAAQHLGVAPAQCLAVEDSPAGARSALAAGMRVAVVPDQVAVPQDVAQRANVRASLLEVIPLLER